MCTSVTGKDQSVEMKRVYSGTARKLVRPPKHCLLLLHEMSMGSKQPNGISFDYRIAKREFAAGFERGTPLFYRHW